jgi:hypothetical protein
MSESIQETPGAMRLDVVLSLLETLEMMILPSPLVFRQIRGTFHVTHVVNIYNPLQMNSNPEIEPPFR